MVYFEHIAVLTSCFLDWSDDPIPPPSPPPPVRQPPPRPAPARPAPAPARPAPPRNGHPLSASALPQCDCNVPAVERTVTKESANKGKRFWTCGQNQTCQFFQWSDGPSASGTPTAVASSSSSRAYPSSTAYSSVSAVVPAKRPHSAVGAERRCGCDLTAVLKVSQSASNANRKYWSCPNGSRQARCAYFEWAADDEDGPIEPPKRTFSSNAGNAPSGGGGGGAGASGSGCYKCGEEGHWASGTSVLEGRVDIQLMRVCATSLHERGASPKKFRERGRWRRFRWRRMFQLWRRRALQ